MNERIRELIVRLVPDAFMTYKGYLYHSSDPKVLEHSDPEPLYTQQELEKFAELIVQECAEQIKLEGTDWIDWMPSQLGIRPEYVAIAQHIKQHFGVEE
jgi:hypothetical protein